MKDSERPNGNGISIFGETKSIKEWLKDERCAVTENTLRSRLKRGWSPEEAVTTPAKRAASPRKKGNFPLGFHKASGQWTKQVNGRRHYFGKDKDAAFEKWIREKDDLLAGVDPRLKDRERVDVGTCCNFMLTRKKKARDLGDITPRHYDDLREMCEVTLEHFGRHRTVASLLPDDFGKLREVMLERWAPTGLIRRIRSIRSIFNFSYKNALLKNPVQFGDQFSVPSKKAIRLYQFEQPEKLFESKEIRAILQVACPHIKAFTLLAINTGIGNADIGTMTPRGIDLDGGWLLKPRRKTGVSRRAKLWPETVTAIEEAVASQEHVVGDYLFVTEKGVMWSNPKKKHCPISQKFRKTAIHAGVYQPGKTFYALRHTFETISGDKIDQIAVDYSMGHDDGSIANVYRARVSDERLQSISEHVYRWLGIELINA